MQRFFRNLTKQVPWSLCFEVMQTYKQTSKHSILLLNVPKLWCATWSYNHIFNDIPINNAYEGKADQCT